MYCTLTSKLFFQVEFDDASAQNAMERQVAEERNRRRCEFMAQKLEKLEKEMNGLFNFFPLVRK
jgi:hypothetical protein